jgi:flavin reductase (DIM6/NTAB) family NADH-FMN oxidoreductase RutF
MEDVSKVTGVFSESVAVLTVKSGDVINAMTAAWTVPVSQRPALVVVHVAPQRYSHDLVVDAKEFGLSILADDQADLAQHAGTASGRKTDKFASGLLRQKPSRVISTPVLEGCAATIECKLEKAISMGDHTIFVGRVVAFESDPAKKPLVLHRGSYYRLGESVGKYY